MLQVFTRALVNTSVNRHAFWPALLCAGLAAGCVLRPARLFAQTAPEEIGGHRIPVPGETVEGTTAKLSEVEAELVAAPIGFSTSPIGRRRRAERLLGSDNLALR
ncbi:MAG: hypothetical protein ACRD2I_07980 [Vicinamibacterales bacterium]